MACLGCHGPDGKGIAAAGFPRLAGLPAGYLSKQLQDFRSGSRKQAVMEPLAKALDDAEIEAISAYLAKLPADPAPDTRRQQIATNPVARLALYGDWSRKIPGCVQCHGPGGSGLMVDVAKAMTDAEVKAVADYFAQPASQEAKP
ncbi:hypothetical protein WR25_26202 [Diploscapter pachys]|uniref:Cytochrome c domain-containing protein n=1 Tax=Diploscapter pachys TaxID=2018661 RepID=A0A2A2KBI1_9BILA|nr:hypothetical protein WR25_26202 [Diploscapter pachys]